MSHCIATSTITPREGILSHDVWHVDGLVASLFISEERQGLMVPGLSWFESLACQSARRAIDGVSLEGRTLFVLSTTKGDLRTPLAVSARRVVEALGIQATPLVVCNACVSGLSALAVAHRLLSLGYYDHAVVCGAEAQSEFIASGFNAFHVLSPRPCRPFDIDRQGLNLGEASATAVLSAHDAANALWTIEATAQACDAYHISMPARDGEGLRSALAMVGGAPSRLAFVNAHGTATLFNDQMESVAFTRAGLKDVPVTALKGSYGHTMGAAGILETVLCAEALAQGRVPATVGYAEPGVSSPLDISAVERATDRRVFLKTLSGFGGCNAAIRVSLGVGDTLSLEARAWSVEATCRIDPTHACTGQRGVPVTAGDGMLRALYRQEVNDYPKFHKMSALAKLAFLASELLLKDGDARRALVPEQSGIVLFTRHSSLEADQAYMATIANEEEYFPSPSIFVYTLPNIAAGEVAIRNGIKGETCTYVTESYDPALMHTVVQATLADTQLTSLITGWVDYVSPTSFEAYLKLIRTT